jgi:hypothetical protein
MMMTSPDFDVCGVVTEANFYQLWANFHRSLDDESFQLTSLGQMVPMKIRSKPLNFRRADKNYPLNFCCQGGMMKKIIPLTSVGQRDDEN